MRTPLFALCLLAAGCSSSLDHAPVASNDCRTPPCGGPGAYGGGSKGTGGGTGASEDAGGATLDGGLGSVAGNVAAYSDATFLTSIPFSGSGTVGVFDERGPGFHRTLGFAGERYALTNVPVLGTLWVTLLPLGQPELLPTITQIVGVPSDANVAFARSSSMNLVFSALLIAPQTMLSARAQLVVKFVGSTEEPVPGVVITQTPSAGAVAYDNDALYSDLTASATQARGTAVVLNATASAWPGSKATVTYRYGTPAALGTFDVYLAQGAVTIATVRLKTT